MSKPPARPRPARNSTPRGPDRRKPHGREYAPRTLPARPAGVPALVLTPGREKSLLRRHPWVFSGAVERVDGNPENGATVAVCDAAGGFLAWAGYSTNS
jgi:23S rRNA (cytosine1962-C5)-methyltransferase